ncbi:MAG: endolytic transglycosylase MltG [Pseudomonadota bacterium]
MARDSEADHRGAGAPPPPTVPPLRGTNASQPSGGLGILPRSASEQAAPGRGPEPPQGRRQRKTARPARFPKLVNGLNGLLTTAFLALLATVAGYLLVLRLYDAPGPAPAQTAVVIPKGDGLQEIADRLVRERVLDAPWLFTLGVLRFQAQTKLRAGEYQFPAGASVRNVLDTLVEGKTIQHKVTVPEGRTSYEVVEILNRHPLLTGQIQTIPPEGSLLPNTYTFDRGTPRTEVLRRMERAQERLIAKLWETRQPNLPVKTIEDAIKLASIVEKETGQNDERERVAAVFVNRLRRNMRLQSDPTIIYGITLGRGKLGRPIRRSDIRRKDDFNTYQIPGLPKTPICNPGGEAIAAVLNPAQTDELYFVADGTGGHVFARTLDEHNANVRNWRQIERRLRARERESGAGSSTSVQPVIPRADRRQSTQGASAVQQAARAVQAGATGVSTASSGTASGGGFPMPGRNPRKR